MALSIRQIIDLVEGSSRTGIFYHVTLSRNLPSIKAKGLVPAVGTLATLAGEDRPAIYLFNNLGAVEDALMGWLGDHLPEDEPLALLKVKIDKTAIDREESDVGYEFITRDPIPFSSIEVLSDDIDSDGDLFEDTEVILRETPSAKELGWKIRAATRADEESYRILDVADLDTWLAGGCAILAFALADLLPGSKLMDVVNLRTGRAEHLVVVRDGYVYDADGGYPVGGFVDRYRKLENLRDDLKLADHDPKRLGEIVHDPKLIALTKEHLRKRIFGEKDKDTETVNEAIHGVDFGAMRERKKKPFIDWHQSGPVAEVELLFVPQPMRGQGIAKKTYQDWERSLPSSIERVELEAVDYDGSGITNHFWEILGFDYKYNIGQLDPASVSHELAYRMWKGVNGHPTPASLPLDTIEEGAYPLAPRDLWYSASDFAQTGGRFVWMKPEQYLKLVRPLDIDDSSRDNIDDLKQHIKNGGKLDPLHIYQIGKEDGRHRAHAAKELGIKEVPVILWEDKTGSISGAAVMEMIRRRHPEDISNPEMVEWVETHRWVLRSMSPDKIVGEEELFDMDDPFHRIIEIDSQHVKKLVEKMKAGHKVEPIVMGPNGSIIDGNHRAQAAKILGLRIPAYFPVEE